ncbi:MAG: hypothetical protein K9L28_06390 [Synergistales bacterium]|nr:hypothetical protein [Synergistales bacterium]
MHRTPCPIAVTILALLLAALAGTVASAVETPPTASSPDHPIGEGPPLQIRSCRYAASIEGFGLYTPRESHAYPSGETARIYLEVEGFALRMNQDTLREIRLALDVRFLSPEGERLAAKRDVVTFHRELRSALHDLYFTVTLDTEPLPVGEYLLQFVLRDEIARSSARAELPLAVETAVTSDDG